jgi:hypothetical protein
VLELFVAPAATPSGDLGWRVGDVIDMTVKVWNHGSSDVSVNAIDVFIDFDKDKLQLVNNTAGATVTPVAPCFSSCDKSVLTLGSDILPANSSTNIVENYYFEDSGAAPGYTGGINLSAGLLGTSQSIPASATKTVATFKLRVKQNPGDGVATQANAYDTTYSVRVRNRNESTSGLGGWRNSAIASAGGIAAAGQNIMGRATDLDVPIKRTIIALAIDPSYTSIGGSLASDRRVGDIIPVDLKLTATTIVRNATSLDAVITFPSADYVLVTSDTDKTPIDANTGTGATINTAGFAFGTGANASATGAANTFSKPSSLPTITLKIDGAALTLSPNDEKTVGRFYVRPTYNGDTAAAPKNLTLVATPSIGIRASGGSLGFTTAVTGAQPYRVAVAKTTAAISLVPGKVSDKTDRRTGDVIPVDVTLTASTLVRNMDAIDAAASFSFGDFVLVDSSGVAIAPDSTTAATLAGSSPFAFTSATAATGGNNHTQAGSSPVVSTVTLKTTGVTPLSLAAGAVKTIARFYVRPKYNGDTDASPKNLTLAATPKIGIRSGTDLTFEAFATTSNGSGATIDVTASSGAVSAVTKNAVGTGYRVDDILFVAGGNGDAQVKVTAVVAATGAIDTIAVVAGSGGTGYSTGTGVAIVGADTVARTYRVAVAPTTITLSLEVADPADATRGHRTGDTIKVDLKAKATDLARNVSSLSATIDVPKAEFVLVDGPASVTLAQAPVLKTTGTSALGAVTDQTMATFAAGSNTSSGVVTGSSTGVVTLAIDGTPIDLPNDTAKVIGSIYVRPRYNPADPTPDIKKLGIGSMAEFGIKQAGTTYGYTSGDRGFQVTVAGTGSAGDVAVKRTEVALSLATTVASSPLRIGGQVKVEVKVAPTNASYVNHLKAVVSVDPDEFQVVADGLYAPLTTGAVTSAQAFGNAETFTGNYNPTNKTITFEANGTSLTAGGTAVKLGEFFIRPRKKILTNPTFTTDLVADEKQTGDVATTYAANLFAVGTASSAASPAVGPALGTVGVGLELRSPTVADPDLTSNNGWTALALNTTQDALAPLNVVDGRYLDVKVVVDAGNADNGAQGADVFNVDLTINSSQLTLSSNALGANVTASGATFTATIDDKAGTPAIGTKMTVSAVTSGIIEPGQSITGTGVTAGTTITAQDSGTPGGVGVYIVSTAQLVTSGTITSTGGISGAAGASTITLRLKKSAALTASGEVARLRFSLASGGSDSSSITLNVADTTVLRQSAASGGIFNTDNYADPRDSVNDGLGEYDHRPVANRVKPAKFNISTLLQGRVLSSDDKQFVQDVTVSLQSVGRFTGSTSSTTLKATGVTGIILPGQTVTGTGVANNTTIVKQLTKTKDDGTTDDGTARPGGAGTYELSTAPSSALTNASLTSRIDIPRHLTVSASPNAVTGCAEFTSAAIAGTTLTVTTLSSGRVAVNDTVTGGGVAANTKVTGQLTGTLGGAGTYSVSGASQTVTPTGSSYDAVACSGMRYVKSTVKDTKPNAKFDSALDDLEPGTYDIYLKGESAVAVVVQAVALGPNANKSISGLVFREGDLDQSGSGLDTVGTNDYTMFSSKWRKIVDATYATGLSSDWVDTGAAGRLADLNRNGFVDILDFSLLSYNYNTTGAFCAPSSGGGTCANYVWGSDTNHTVSASRTGGTTSSASLDVAVGAADASGVVAVTVGVTPGSRPVDGAQVVLKTASGVQVVNGPDGGTFAPSESNPMPVILQQAWDAARGLIDLGLGRAPSTGGLTTPANLGTIYVKVPAGFTGAPVTVEHGDGLFTTTLASAGADVTGALNLRVGNATTSVNVGSPTADLPTSGVVAIEGPDTQMPSVPAPAISAPAAQAPAVQVPSVELPRTDLPAIETPAVEVPITTPAPLSAPVVALPMAPAVAAPARAAAPASAPASSARPSTSAPTRSPFAPVMIENRTKGTLTLVRPGTGTVELKTGLATTTPDAFCPVARHKTYIRLEDTGIAGATFGVEAGGVLSWVTPDQAGCVNWNAISEGGLTFNKETIMQFQLAQAVPGALLWVLDGNRNGELYEVDAQGVANYVTADAFAANQDHFTEVWANVIPVSTSQIEGLSARGSVHR